MKRMTSLSRISRKLLKPFRGKESGMAFTAVLAFLVLGALIITPILGFMITGLKAGQAHEARTTELYSADAGVQYAIWYMQHGGLLNNDGSCNLAIGETLTLTWISNENEEFGIINGDNVVVTILNEDDIYFKVVSRATDIATGSWTEVVSRMTPVEAYRPNVFTNGMTGLGSMTASAFVDGNAECSEVFTVEPSGVIGGDVTCRYLDNKGVIKGDVWCETLNNKGIIEGNVRYTNLVSLGTVWGTVTYSTPPDMGYLDEIWPEEDYLSNYYIEQVVVDPIYPFTEVNWGPTTIPEQDPLNPNLEIGLYTGYDSKDNPRSLLIKTGDPTKVVKLGGTIFVTGDFNVAVDSTVDLNGKTIYCLGDVYFAPGSNVRGTGVIIAIGTVTFQPNIIAGGEGAESAIIYYNGTNWVRQGSGTWWSLNGVWGSASNNVYAVGESGTIIHYNAIDDNLDGQIWDPVASPTTLNLNAIWGSSSDNIWAVGDTGTILNFDGSAWLPVASGTIRNLNGVWGSPSDGIVYAVGEYGTILQYQGGSWSAMESNTSERLHAVCGRSATDVYAVGAHGTLLRYNGTSWMAVNSGTNLSLNGVWCSSTSDIFITGDDGTLKRYNTAWPMPISMSVDSGVLSDNEGIWGTSAVSPTLFSVGQQGVVLSYRVGIDPMWKEFPPQNMPTSCDLEAVWGTSSADVFAVGRASADFIFVQSITDSVTLQPNQNGAPFHGAVAGYKEKENQTAVDVKAPGSLIAPENLGRVNLPRYRWMRITSYIIEQGG